jgi:putative DNA primase/helicase
VVLAERLHRHPVHAGCEVKLIVSYGHHAADNKPVRYGCTLQELFAWLATMTPRTGEKDGPYLVFADFGTEAKADTNPKSPTFGQLVIGIRAYSHLELSYAVPIDLDKGDWTLERITATLKGYQWIAWTTYKSAPGAERWRVVVPVDRGMSRHEHRATWEQLNAAFCGQADPAAKDATRLNYLPGPCLHPEAARLEWEPNGVPLVVVPAGTVSDDVSNPDAWTQAPVTQWTNPESDDELIEIAKRSRSASSIFGDKASFRDLWEANALKLNTAFPSDSPGKPWNGSAADQALANRLAFWTGGDCERIERLMLKSALVRDKWEHRPNYLRATIAEACAAAAKLGKYYRSKASESAGESAPAAPVADPQPSDADPRAVLLLRGGEFDKYTAAAEQLLADTIYVRGGKLVRIGSAAEISNEALKDEAGTTRDAAQAVCIPASHAWIRRALMERAQFWKYDKRAREWERRDCPKELAENIGDQQAWSNFRPLVAISPVPVLRRDMSLCTDPGYDVQTAIYYQPTMAMPDILSSPTRDDALRALNRLFEPFNQFPYASNESLSVFVSHVLCAVLRTSFDTSPVYLYTSPVAATGKTLLCDMPNSIANGTQPAHSPYSEGEELRKVLFSSLLAGDSALVIDNVANGLKVRAPGLCVFVTSAAYADRILGASENRKVPNRCTVVLTGNNITPVSDMARRSLVVRLDANAESARGRQFRIADLKSHVRQHRAQLIVDALTIVRAYALAGWPKVAHPLESFEQWSRIARDPLVWLGMADPVASQVTETDDEVEPLRAAFLALAEVTQQFGLAFKSAQIADVARNRPALREALSDAGCSEPADPKKVSYWLREQKDRVAAGWKLTSDGATGGVARWKLKAI